MGENASYCYCCRCPAQPSNSHYLSNDNCILVELNWVESLRGRGAYPHMVHQNRIFAFCVCVCVEMCTDQVHCFVCVMK